MAKQVINEYENLKVGKKVLAAIPCLNTERTIGEVVPIARKYADIVVVINDGSTDNTAKVAEAAGATVVNHPSHMGFAGITKTSFEVAKINDADVLVTLDGDAQHNPAEIERVVTPILKCEADIVIGSRFLSSEENMPDSDFATLLNRIKSLCPHKMPVYRKFGILLITWLFNLGSRVKLTDAQSGFRAFNCRAFEVCYPLGMGVGVSVEVLVKARQGGLKISEVPISCIYHIASSTRNPFLHGLDVILATIELRFKEAFNRWNRR